MRVERISSGKLASTYQDENSRAEARNSSHACSEVEASQESQRDLAAKIVPREHLALLSATPSFLLVLESSEVSSR